MGLKFKPYNDAQRKCAEDLFIILAPTRGAKEISVGINPKVTGSNYIDGLDNPDIGIIEPIKRDGIADTNFYPIADLLNFWFKQNIVTYSQKKFYRDEAGNDVPREVPVLPAYWRLRDEDCAYSTSQFRDFEYYVNRVQQLFWNDEEMGEKVRALTVPVADSTE